MEEVDDEQGPTVPAQHAVLRTDKAVPPGPVLHEDDELLAALFVSAVRLHELRRAPRKPVVDADIDLELHFLVEELPHRRLLREACRDLDASALSKLNSWRLPKLIKIK